MASTTHLAQLAVRALDTWRADQSDVEHLLQASDAPDRPAVRLVSGVHSAAGVTDNQEHDMPQFIIERNVEGASKLEADQLADISAKSNEVVSSLGVPYKWATSYMAGVSYMRVKGHLFLPGGGQWTCPVVAIRTAQLWPGFLPISWLGASPPCRWWLG